MYSSSPHHRSITIHSQWSTQCTCWPNPNQICAWQTLLQLHTTTANPSPLSSVIQPHLQGLPTDEKIQITTSQSITIPQTPSQWHWNYSTYLLMSSMALPSYNHHPSKWRGHIAHDKANMASVRIYSDGSRINDRIGAAAVLYINNSMQQSLQYHLGSDKHHTVYEAQLVGLTLATALLQQLDFLEDGTITINNQAAVKAITSFHSTPGQQIIDFFINKMTELTKWHKGVPFEVY